MSRVVLSLGSNHGERSDQLVKAIKWLGEILNNINVSNIYETPCAMHQGRPYLNCVISGESTLPIQRLDLLLKEYEIKNGRTKECREAGEVPIDIDIVLADNKILKDWDFRQNFFKIGYNEIYSNI